MIRGAAAAGNQHLKYRPDIDGLRALAILLVVLFHALPTMAPGGFIGVDIFFVISGYLISGIILKSLDAGSFSLADFYVRRCRRILPALGIVLVTVWVVGWLFLMPEEFRYLGKETLAGATFTENFMAVREAGYFDASSIRKPLLHLWSLGVEEQFYIFWPLLLMLTYRLKMNAGYLIAGFMAISIGVGLYFDQQHSTAAFYMLPARFWELLCGALLAYGEKRGTVFRFHKTLWANQLAGTVAFLAIIIFALALHGEMFVSLWYKLVPCLAAATLIALGTGAWPTRVLLANQPAVFIGRISYPLYLWHWPLLSLNWVMNEGHPTPASVFGTVTLSVVLATLTYLLLEKPAQKYSARFKAMPILTSAAGVIVMLSLLGYSAFTQRAWQVTAPWPTVIETNELDHDSILRTIDRTWWTTHGLGGDQKCVASDWSNKSVVDYCRLTHDRPRVAIIGDSHANHLVPGLESLNDPTFSRVVQVSFGGCINFGDVQITSISIDKEKERACTEGNRHYLEMIRTDPNIKYVIISNFWRGNSNFDQRYADSDRLEALPGTNFDPNLSKMDLLREGVSRLMTAMEKAGKRVIIFIDIPGYSIDPVDCINLRRFSLADTHPVCRVTRTQVVDNQEREQRIMIKALAKRHPQLIVVDPTDQMCGKDDCYAIKDRKMLYRDALHLSVDGSPYAARALVEALHRSGIN